MAQMASDATPIVTPFAPTTTINPVHEIIPKATNLNPRSLTSITAPPAYPVQPLAVPATNTNPPSQASAQTQPARLDAILEEKVVHSGLNEAIEALAYPVHRTSTEVIT
nr:protein SIEVE ELEMENT OCCLUSION B-like [Ipomoea batatas]